jgi:hypothetical protein
MGLDFYLDPMFKDILKKARDRTASWGGKLFLFTYQIIRVIRQGLRTMICNKKRGALIDIVTSLNVPLIDIQKKVFENHPDPLSLFPFRQYGHYTPEANTNIANAITLSVGE